MLKAPIVYLLIESNNRCQKRFISFFTSSPAFIVWFLSFLFLFCFFRQFIEIYMFQFSFEIDGGEGHLLFRPVGQVAFAQGVGMAVFKKQMAETEVFRKLDRYDADGGFSNINLPQSLWYGILYDPNKKRILVSGRDLAAKLIVYLLGGVDNEFDRAELRRQIAEARTIGDYAIGFDGKLVTPKEVGLPAILAWHLATC